MKYHIVTAALLLGAAALYVAGFGSSVVIVLAAAVALEIGFWMRIARGSSRTGHDGVL